MASVIGRPSINRLRYARNHHAWALGTQERNGFHVRRVVWGLLMASAEVRPGEQIRKASIMVGGKPTRPLPMPTMRELQANVEALDELLSGPEPPL